MTETESGLYPVHINEMVTMLTRAYVSLIQTGTPFRSFPSVMIWGPPGVGKSQGVRQVAEKIEQKTGKQVVIHDVRLLLFNPVDLRGIPTADKDKTLAIWLRPKIFAMDERPEVVNILFLDEISAAPPSVQAAAYQITLDRTVGEHKLPENCIVLAAGNRATDRSVAYNMPKALANRLCHFEIKGDPKTWHDWAVQNGIHPYVTGFLEYNVALLMRFTVSASQYAFPTPRSWEMVSHILRTVSDKIDEVYPMIVGCIGRGTASVFKEWTTLYPALPPMEAVFRDDPEIEIPKEKELRIALRSAMVEYASTHPEKEGIDCSVQFACRLPWEFRNKLLHDYDQSPAVRPIIRENEVYKTAVRDRKK